MLPDRVSNPGPLTYESSALPTALRGPARNPNLFLGGWGCGGRGVNIMYKCLKWHFYSSRNSNVPNYSEILA